jgi:hypothetical protein
MGLHGLLQGQLYLYLAFSYFLDSLFHPTDGNSTFLLNVGELVPDYKALHPAT